MGKTNNVAFNLTKIHTEEFAIIEGQTINPDELENTLQIGYGASPIDHFIQCGLKFEIFSEEKVFIIIHVICTFEIEAKAWENSFLSEKRIIIKKNIAHHLAVFTTGTARGVLHAKTEGTSLNKFFIPQLNIDELIQEDVLIEISNVV